MKPTPLNQTKKTIGLTLFISLILFSSLKAATIYVKANNTGVIKNGSSWTYAYDNFQIAVNAAQSGDEIWVAAGEYQPGNLNSFSMKEGVKIYGGFTGTETTRSQRNWQTNVTILKGNGASVINNSGLTTTALLDGFTITSGDAESGGGIYNYNSSPLFSNLIISGNGAAENGGGIFNYNSSPLFSNLIISGNGAAENGGGIFNHSSSPVLTNVTISGNRADFSGGAIRNSVSNPIIKNSIIYGNSTGIFNISSTPNISYSLVQDMAADAANHNLDGATNPNFISPLAPGLNSGGDYRLQNSSPAIGAGNNTFYAVGQTPDLSAITTDLAGNARIQKGKIDLGAYESEFDIALVPDASGVIYVTTAGAGNKSGNSWTNASDDLQMAINAANVKQVWVAGGTYKPKYRADNMSAANANDRNNAFVLKNNVQVYGGFAGTETLLGDRNLNNTVNATTLSGDFNGDDAGFTNNGENAYHVVVSSGNNNSAMLNGFTLSGANASSSANILINGNQVYQCSGGGIYLSASSPVLQNLIITRNTVSESGGGIFGYESSPLLSGITMQGNQAKDGGGMANQSQSSPVLSNIIITDNGASELGGGLYNVTSSSPVLTNVSIGANTANSGGGIYNAEASSNPQIRNSIIYGNNTGIEGSGTPVVSYSLVQGSTDITNGNIDGNTNPDFVDASNGDYRLQNSSPAIGAGNNTFYAAGQTPDLSTITTDLAGNARIQKGKIDLGAYESEFNIALVPDANNILYVNKSVAGGKGTGDSWENAILELSDALLWAQQTQISRTSTNPLKIYIAKGTYKPLYNAADGQNTADGGRDNAFVLSKNVKVYGGFDPANNISTLVNQRIFGENGTILSGNIGIQNDNSDNAYHVVISAGDLGATLLDGVVIEEGRAENPGGVKIVVNGENIYRNAGAGFYNNGASNVLKNVLIRNNYSEGHGSGIYNDGASINQQATHLLVSNSIISNNSGTGEGSFTCSGATATYLNTNFISNSGAAAQDSYNSTTNIYNSIWYNNGFTTPSCTNSTKVGMVKNSIVVNLVGINQELQHILQEPTNLMFESSQISYNDLFVLTSASPGVNKGSNTAYTTNGGDLINDKDLANNSRVYNGDIIDIGAYEYQGDPITLPVTLVSYDAKKNNNTTVLQWQSASEQNNKGYVIYRSSDGKVFVKLGDIRANDLFLYTYTDYSPLNGNNYYKLVQVDNDGKETDLGIRSLNFSLSALGPQLYPNPTTDKIYLNTDANDTYTLLNSVGQKLRTGNATALRNGLDVSELPAGLYLITIAQKTYKFLKR
ncbi:choice-of-anchor Q domain-containing protein [Pedobacter sp.]